MLLLKTSTDHMKHKDVWAKAGNWTPLMDMVTSLYGKIIGTTHGANIKTEAKTVSEIVLLLP